MSVTRNVWWSGVEDYVRLEIKTMRGPIVLHYVFFLYIIHSRRFWVASLLRDYLRFYRLEMWMWGAASISVQCTRKERESGS